MHDVAQDFYGDEWLGVFEGARKGAFKALDRLRDEGVIRAWGLGVNRVEPIELVMALDGARPTASCSPAATRCSITIARCSA